MPAPVRPRQGEEDAHEEGQVLAQVGGQARPLVALHAEAPDVHALEVPLPGLARPAQAEDVDRPAGRGE